MGLRELSPEQIDFIVDETRKPPSRWGGLLGMLFGLLMMSIGIGAFLEPRRDRSFFLAIFFFIFGCAGLISGIYSLITKRPSPRVERILKALNDRPV